MDVGEIALRSELQRILPLAAKMKAEGRSDDEVRSHLAHMGLRDRNAEEVLAALGQVETRARKRRGLRNLLVGALWLIGGIVVTGLSFDAASIGGGTAVVAYGAIAAGFVQAGLGAHQLARR